MERFVDYFVPERYILDLEIDKHKKTIGGRVIIEGVAKAEKVKFHAVGLSVDEVRVNGKKADFELKDGVLTLSKVPNGDLEVEVRYHGSLNENMEGAYLSTYEYKGKTETIVATQFESHYAREAFPCIDEPAAKAVFELAITVPDKDDMIIANMPEVFEKHRLGHTQGRSAKLTVLDDAFSKTFQPTPRMSTYLLAFVIGKFHGKTIKNAHGVEIATYCTLAQDVDAVDFANEVAAKSLEFYDDNFKKPYPLERCLQVALPDFEAGAMENWGLVTYRESMLLSGKNATLGTRKGVALTVAHELAHQWFGNLVTMEWWDDLWLNESFASAMEYYAVDANYPKFKIWESFFTGDSLAALMRDCLTGVQSVHQDVKNPAEIATLFDSAIVYSKGARLMLMLIRLMGWEKFCEGVADYFEKYRYANAVGDDLWECMEPYAEFDVAEMMHAFIDRSGYPVITGVDEGKFEQKRFLIDAEMADSDWPLPAVEEDMSGHYVLNLSDEEFEKRLARFDKLGMEEKLRLLIDRNLLSKTDLVSAASLVPLIEKFKNEESAAVWSIIVTIVANLKVFFDPGTKDETEFKKFVRGLVAPGLERIGLFTRDDDDENTLKLRAILTGMDFYAENKGDIRKLAERYEDDYENMVAEDRGNILDAKLYCEPEMIREYLARYKKTHDPEVKFELLLAGTISKNAKVLARMMKLLDQPEVVKPQDQLYLFIYLFRNHKVQEEVFEWLTEHWDYVKGLAGDKSIESYPRYTAGAIRTREMYERWLEFFEPMADDAALARAIEIGKREIEARLELIKEDAEAVKEAIKTK